MNDRQRAILEEFAKEEMEMEHTHNMSRDGNWYFIFGIFSKWSSRFT